MIVYKLTNLINGKCYIGATTRTLNERINGHLSDTRKGSPCAIHEAIRKYGIENFSIETLEDNIEDADMLMKAEIFYIKMYESHGSKGYNLTDGGKGASGHTVTPELRKRLSDLNKGQGLGRKLSEETKKKLSIGKMGNKSWLGKKLSPESIAKRTETRRLNRLNKETHN